MDFLSDQRVVEPEVAPLSPDKQVRALALRLVPFTFFNLFLVACLGVLLRAFPVFAINTLSYKSLLHGHSHFAFGGWIMPILLACLLLYFPDLGARVAYRHWRNIAALMLFSAYGMLLAFPVQGYGPAGIFFSTLSLGSSFYLSWACSKALAAMASSPATQFLKAGLLYLVISAIGPVATGPLIVLGKAGTPLYYNAVYFYLHFQYNGWFTFAVLALLYQMMGEKAVQGRKVYYLMNAACIPAYLLSVLWIQPPFVVNVVAGMAAALQIAAVYFLLKDASLALRQKGWAGLLLRLSMGSLVLKNLLQFLGAFPSVALMAYGFKNFVIAYLHLVMLGFISLFALALVMKHCREPVNLQLKAGILVFLAGFCITELLLVGHAAAGYANLYFPQFYRLIFGFSLLLPLGLALISRAIFRMYKGPAQL